MATVVIAEAGSITTAIFQARRLVEAAAAAGRCSEILTFRATDLASVDAPKGNIKQKMTLGPVNVQLG